MCWLGMKLVFMGGRRRGLGSRAVLARFNLTAALLVVQYGGAIEPCQYHIQSAIESSLLLPPPLPLLILLLLLKKASCFKSFLLNSF
ncbi:hypothetical protein AMTRI_Chr04g247950 [Amborella trichopoda]